MAAAGGGIYMVAGGAPAGGDAFPHLPPEPRVPRGRRCGGCPGSVGIGGVSRIPQQPEGDGVGDGGRGGRGSGRPGPALLDHHAAREVLGEVLEELRGGPGAVGEFQLLQLLQLHQPRKPRGGQQGAACRETGCAVSPEHQRPPKIASQKPASQKIASQRSNEPTFQNAKRPPNSTLKDQDLQIPAPQAHPHLKEEHLKTQHLKTYCT